jgi:hypothetical protein
LSQHPSLLSRTHEGKKGTRSIMDLHGSIPSHPRPCGSNRERATASHCGGDRRDERNVTWLRLRARDPATDLTSGRPRGASGLPLNICQTPPVDRRVGGRLAFRRSRRRPYRDTLTIMAVCPVQLEFNCQFSSTRIQLSVSSFSECTDSDPAG